MEGFAFIGFIWLMINIMYFMMKGMISFTWEKQKTLADYSILEWVACPLAIGLIYLKGIKPKDVYDKFRSGSSRSR